MYSRRADRAGRGPYVCTVLRAGRWSAGRTLKFFFLAEFILTVIFIVTWVLLWQLHFWLKKWTHLSRKIRILTWKLIIWDISTPKNQYFDLLINIWTNFHLKESKFDKFWSEKPKFGQNLTRKSKNLTHFELASKILTWKIQNFDLLINMWTNFHLKEPKFDKFWSAKTKIWTNSNLNDQIFDTFWPQYKLINLKTKIREIIIEWWLLISIITDQITH